MSGTPIGRNGALFLLYGRFSATTRGMRDLGAANDVALTGMMMITVRGTGEDEPGSTPESPARLPLVEKFEFSFDVMSVLQQLRHALSGNMERARSHFVVPNKVSMLPPSEVLPRIIIDVEDPNFPVVNANSVWMDLFHGRGAGGGRLSAQQQQSAGSGAAAADGAAAGGDGADSSQQEEAFSGSADGASSTASSSSPPPPQASSSSSSSSSSNRHPGIIGMSLRYVLTDFKLANQEVHAGMSNRMIEVKNFEHFVLVFFVLDLFVVLEKRRRDTFFFCFQRAQTNSQIFPVNK